MTVAHRIGRFASRTPAGFVAGLLLLIAPAAIAGTSSPSRGNVYDFRVATIDSGPRALSDYRGKVLLIVNTASRCGFTRQYQSLETLYGRYRAEGLEVLAFPANNFMNQEPGTNEEIQSFCSLTYHTTFPLFAKIDVKGKQIAPLYAWLTRKGEFGGDVSWNFTKFLVDRSGAVVGRFDPRTDPLDPRVTARIESALNSR